MNNRKRRRVFIASSSAKKTALDDAPDHVIAAIAKARKRNKGNK